MPTTLTEHPSKTLLGARGLPIPRGCEAASLEAARQTAEALGFPLGCRISREGLVRKTEASGVILGVRDLAALDAAMRDLLERGGPGARVRIEAPIDPGAEVIAGLRRDPLFGPVVMLGLGGLYAEVLRDMAVRLCPVSAKTAHEMMEELRGYPILARARGRACRRGPGDRGGADARRRPSGSSPGWWRGRTPLRACGSRPDSAPGTRRSDRG
jgi:hypothetical protein